jgi:hypothetical protein
MINIGQKPRFFSLIRSPAAIAKSAKTQVASLVRLGSLTPHRVVMVC